MDILQAIRHALDGNAVLFLGSGFSYGAKNSLNATLPQATELANLMLIEIKYKTTGNTSLTQASKSYEKHKGKNSLIEFLYRQLLAVETQKYHRTISKTPWYQIYTTNFDDVFEFSQSEVIDSLQKKLNRPKLGSSIKEKLKARLDVLKRDSVTTDLEGYNCP